MVSNLLKYVLCGICLLHFGYIFSQIQTCPYNIDFSARDISTWSATTGLVGGGTQNYPAPNNGVTSLPEYTISTPGIRVITTPGTDAFGGFSTLPVINGYSYNYSVQLGSSVNSSALNSNSRSPGGFTRSITYRINVPAGPTTVPYTMTYAYALVLEDGTHNSENQPLFKATLATNTGIVTCASPQYYLPTLNDANPGNGGGVGTGATLDTAAALANGFTNSPVPSPNNNNNPDDTPFRVWTKGWTEVTFDLSPYRGQQVSLTFEADNCVPGAHFAYAYVALRNICAGLQISGYSEACSNTINTYSIPALAGATYQWTVPSGWSIVSGSNSNILQVIPGASGGTITARERNSCADLTATLPVTVRPPTIAGSVASDSRVCEGINSTLLSLSGYQGSILNWAVSTNNGNSWSSIPGTAGATSYNAQNLTATTIYRAVVQNGNSCSIDTSEDATIIVDPKTVGGRINPATMNFCLGQSRDATLTLRGETGAIQYWQYSYDATNWTTFSNTNNTYDIPPGTTQSTQYRAVVQSGVCPAENSTVANVNVLNALYPQQTISPIDTTICYEDTAQLNSLVTIGTSYTWSNGSTLTDPASGTIPSTPSVVTNYAYPLTTTRYMLSILNAGCPNALTDTFQVNVLPPIIVNLGRDTSIVYNQPLQLQANSSYTTSVSYTWMPSTGLNNTTISNPVTMLGIHIDSVRYTARVSTAVGCYGTDDILVRVFKTNPDIFVPNAFTPSRSTNNLFRPIPVGIASIDYFRVYNRWGQLVYNSINTLRGWDGKLGGKDQGAGTYVWMVLGKDYTGKIVFRKGTMVLIR